MTDDSVNSLGVYDKFYHLEEELCIQMFNNYEPKDELDENLVKEQKTKNGRHFERWGKSGD